MCSDSKLLSCYLTRMCLIKSGDKVGLSMIIIVIRWIGDKDKMYRMSDVYRM